MSKKTTINDCSLIELGRNHDRAGNLTVFENLNNYPFIVKRVFYLYDIPAGESRGAHAHKFCHQLIVAASGSFEIEMDDTVSKKSIFLNRPFEGLHIPPGIWAHEYNFSSGAICLVLTSDLYCEDDYLRNYQEYVLFRQGKGI